MTEQALVGLAGIVLLGIAAQWLAWRLKFPSILLLLIFGFVAGPVTGFLDPDRLLGDLLFPVVSLSVAVILFEGGLSLKAAEFREMGGVIRRLVTVGALATWVIAALGARFLLGFITPLAILFGAILVVTGPTVILPLLRQVKPGARVGSILKWEGIMIDPIGAILAVLTFEAIIAGRAKEATALAAAGLAKTVLIGGAVGVAGAVIVILFLRRYWLPDFLHNPASLAMVFFVFVAANRFQAESGLLAVTIMGLVLINQKWVAVRHIVEFKESLGVLLISSLFILLAARLRIEDLKLLDWPTAAFLAVLILLARPAAVALSTIGSDLNRKERLFLSWIAPRGIVAAAVASVFALRLTEAGFVQARQLVPLTFMVIIGTVAIYGLTASPVARWLKISSPGSLGVLLVGAHPLARAIGKALKEEGFRVLLVDTNRSNVYTARMEGLEAHHGNVLSERFLDEAEIEGLGRMMAMTPNDEVNSLAVLHCAECFERSELYQLCLSKENQSDLQPVPHHLRGRLLFGGQMTYGRLSKLIAAGAAIKRTPLTDEFGFQNFVDMCGQRAIPLFLVGEGRNLTVYTADQQPEPVPGQTLISLISPEDIPPGGRRS